MPEGGITDRELLKRLGAVYGEAFVAGVESELAGARKDGDEALVAEIHTRFTYRMHSLSEFMKTLLQRFTRWFNRTHVRCGTLWEYSRGQTNCGISCRIPLRRGGLRGGLGRSVKERSSRVRLRIRQSLP